MFALIAALGLFPATSTAEEAATEPPLSGERLTRVRELFSSRCASCHEEDGNAAEPAMNLADRFWRHGGTLPEIEKTIREGVPETKMKAHGERLGAEEIADLARYVLQLAATAHGRAAGTGAAAATGLTDQVAPRLPPASREDVAVEKLQEGTNLIDEHIFSKLRADGVPHAPLATDAEFLRRVYLDLWGRLPDVPVVREFLASRDAAKRDKLIDRLLGLDFLSKPGNDDYKGPWLVEKPFISKWAYFFGDLFRNGSQGSVEEFHRYLTLFIKYNVPYDHVVRDMLTTTALTGNTNGAAGFLIRNQVDGLRCADVMHEDTCDEIALNSTKVFLGVDLECVSCHDGAGHVDGLNLWLSRRKRIEFWRQAAFFGNLRIFRPSLANQEFTLLTQQIRKILGDHRHVGA